MNNKNSEVHNNISKICKICFKKNNIEYEQNLLHNKNCEFLSVRQTHTSNFHLRHKLLFSKRFLNCCRDYISRNEWQNSENINFSIKVRFLKVFVTRIVFSHFLTIFTRNYFVKVLYKTDYDRHWMIVVKSKKRLYYLLILTRRPLKKWNLTPELFILS